MGEGDRLALHQVLACHLEQWHRYPPITAAADLMDRALEDTALTLFFPSAHAYDLI